MSAPIILWLRRDLRLTDNLALGAALERDQPIVPLFIFDPALLQSERIGPPRLKFMLAALESLDAKLRTLGTRLLIRHGHPLAILHQLVQEIGAEALFFNRDYTPFARRRDQAVAEQLPIAVQSFHDAILHPPTTVLKQDGTPYSVYTPFKNAWLKRPVTHAPHRAPVAGDFYTSATLNYPPVPSLADLGFAPTIEVFPASESEAQKRLHAFIPSAISTYRDQRNLMRVEPNTDAEAGTSSLSPYLRFGLLSPRQAWQAAEQAAQTAPSTQAEDSIRLWQSELIWRDFYMHILYFYPHVKNRNFRSDYDRLDWRNAPDDLQAWQTGRTGYPVVDAAMRQLTTIGWMHNRARMIVASFLTKDLLIDWREGELYFMRWLLDGDLAANNGGWQWAAGTGTDAQPYFRIFNPISQSEKFDPDGTYIRRWVPELRQIKGKLIHTPWLLATPPANYPQPIVDHTKARQRTLIAYKNARAE